MGKNKILQSVSALDRKAMTRFCDFVHSPYHNKHEGVRSLLRYLSRVYPDFSERTCDPDLLRKQVMEETDLAASSFPPILTYAQRLFEAFLVQEGLRADDYRRQLYVLQGLRQYELFSQYEKQLNRSEKALARAQIQDTRYLQFSYELGLEAGEYFIQMERRRADSSLARRQDAFDVYFISEKLRDACELQVRRQILKGEYQQRFLGAVLEHIRADPDHYRAIPAIYVYYAMYQMLEQGEPAQYYTALEALQERRESFDRAEQILLYNYLMNYCIARINRNDPVFLQELFTLYKVQLSNDLLLEDGYLSEWDYKNIVTTALRLNDLNWARQFIDDYRKALRPESRDNAYRFNKAAYHYEAGEYDEVLALLTRVEYSDLRYSLGTRALLMRTYYDLGEYDALHALTESFRQYLQRNQLMSDQRRLGYYNLFRLARKAALLRSRLPYWRPDKVRRDLQRIRQEAEATEAVFNRGWLEEKLRELEGEVVG